jgi:hypothetical protein
MASILRTASYVRSDRESGARNSGVALRSILNDPELDRAGGERIWALLETPQTIETLCRVLSVEALAGTQLRGRAVESFLEKLYEQDLIEVTADS